jgi:CheY-like chemotaxis protein
VFVEARRASGVLLIVEDDREMRSLLCDELWDIGCRIVEASDGDEALQRLEGNPPDLIITDLKMPAGGMDYLARLKTLAPNSPIILITAFGGADTKAQALRHGATAYFDKPVRMADLRATVKQLLPPNQLTPLPRRLPT